MLISMNWISDFVDLTGLDKMALIRQFSLSTAEVENEIFHKGADLSGVVAAQIVSVENHPESHKLHLLKVDAGDCDAPYMSTLWHDGQVVGETTSGAWGYRVGHSMALGMLRADLCAPGTEVEVEIFGDRVKATVLPDGPAWDAKNERIRA